MSTICPKCAYERKASDTAPDWQCPSCGVVYAKFNAAPPAAGPSPQANPPAGPDEPGTPWFKLVLAIVLCAIAVLAVHRVIKQRQDKLEASAAAQLAATRAGGPQDDDGMGTHLIEPGQEHAAAPAANPDALVKQLLAEPDRDKRKSAAAAIFFAFYFSNTRARLDLCRGNGVDISAFVSAVTAAHTMELAVARTFLSKYGTTEEWMYETNKPMLANNAAQNVQAFASARKLNIKQACQLMADDSQRAVESSRFATAAPEVYKILMQQ